MAGLTLADLRTAQGFSGLPGKSSVQVTGRFGQGLCNGKTGVRIISLSQIQVR